MSKIIKAGDYVVRKRDKINWLWIGVCADFKREPNSKFLVLKADKYSVKLQMSHIYSDSWDTENFELCESILINNEEYI